MALNDKLINYGNLAEFHNQLINDSSDSDYATWSSSKISDELDAKQGTLSAGNNISINNGAISAVGYSYDTTKGNLTQICQDETANVNTAQKNNVCLGENNSITGAETEASTIVGGYGNTVTGSACVVGGFGCSASGTGSVAMGYETSANGFNTTFGYKTQATAQGAFAAGNGTSQKALIASGQGAAAFGKSALSSGEASFAAGDNVTASAQSSQAFGNGTVASGNQAFAEGYGTVASGLDSHAEGSHTEAAGSMQHVQGKYNIVDNNGTYADIIGNGTADNARSNAYTMTWAGKSWFADDVTSGGTNATPAHTLSNKQDVLSAGNGISLSSNTVAVDGIVITRDNNNGYHFATKYVDDDDNQIKTNVANGAYSDWAEGSKTTATSAYGGNHAEGYTTTASGAYGAHAEGGWTTASGELSHAEGSFTTASGTAAHAEGIGGGSYRNVVSSGEGSHAEGLATLASAPNAHAEGRLTNATNTSEHAQGAANISHKANNTWGDAGNTLHSIGNGYYDNTRNNVLEIMQNGDLYLSGIGGWDGKHIKGESGAPSGLQTLQEYIASLESRIAALENTANS